ncbi:cysteine-rich CWC family protein [Caballeronia sordidicola]|uniref:cysteine-rich CWC family protein n=1 Tax=Caballeronia sordidicola TaxID=196367 RepID=UPI00094FF2FF|nr:cysteine-rich CWC family protein [Caballeronia sordidicola]
MLSRSVERQNCARCGAQFHCGQQAGDAACWCTLLPPLPVTRLEPDLACLCPACLREDTERAAPK